MPLKDLTLYLAAPRGFCAGVDRAIQIVELALGKWGAPVYVRHEIVHNKFVVDELREKGAIFVEELDECPDDRPVIFSAHGVPKAVPAEAAKREMIYVDATCPLVSKVHIEAERHHAAGLKMVMIGHEGHPETVGTMGQLPEGDVLLVETCEDVAKLNIRDPEKLAFVTQTTLSIDDTADIDKATAIVMNAKTQRYGTCCTLESLLVAEQIAAEVLPALCKQLIEKGVELRGCENTRALVSDVNPASSEDWASEYLAPILSIKIVEDMDEAIVHINTYSSQHTESIVTEDYTRAQRFLREVDSSSVMVNASTRFADGFEYGLGAEIGLSTDKLHARGPVGLEGLTSQKYIVLGDGHIRQ